MKQREYRVSDAIPEMTASFDRTTESTLRSVCSETSKRTVRMSERRPIRLNKKAWIAIAVAATLLITTTAFAATAIIRHNYHSPETYMMQPSDVREPIPDVENAIASAKPETGDYSIVMLPEREDADELNACREAKGQPVYSETDWGWIREIRPEVEEVLLDGTSLIFNIRLNTDHGASFGWDQSQAQMVDALCDDAYFVTEDGRVGQLLGLGTGITPTTVSADGATLYTESDLDDLKEPFPTDGTVRITAEIGIRDVRVSDMGNAGLLATIRYTFTFNASAGADVAEPVVTERALSGSVVLTMIETGGREYNKRVSLDGVVLEETVSYRSTGVYVSYRVKSAPEGWTPEDTKALLQACFESSLHYGFSVQCAPKGSTEEDAVQKAGFPNSIPNDEYICILPIFPSDYAQAKEQGIELRLGYRCIDTFNDTPVGDDWHMPQLGWDDEYEWTTVLQPIAVFELPLP